MYLTAVFSLEAVPRAVLAVRFLLHFSARRHSDREREFAEFPDQTPSVISYSSRHHLLKIRDAAILP